MACKYKYNNNWFSKEELQSILYKERGIDKYGKLEKPNIKTPKKSKYLEEILVLFDAKIEKSSQKIIINGKTNPDKYLLKNYSGKLFNTVEEAENFRQETLRELRAKISNDLNIDLPFTPKKEDYKNLIGIQPTQTKDNLKESIDSVKSKIISTNPDIENNFIDILPTTQIDEQWLKDNNITKQGYMLADYSGQLHKSNSLFLKVFDTEQEANRELQKFLKENQKEYTSQALINTKIAKLKEVAKKYPLSLIRSEVRPTESQFYKNLGFEDGMPPFQKIQGQEELGLSPLEIKKCK